MADFEKTHALHERINNQHNTNDSDTDFIPRQITRSGTNVTISSELFEKMYLNPKVADPPGMKHPLQKLFGNPTPLGIVGFELSLMPLAMEMMGWRQAGGGGSFQNAAIIFYGGVLVWVAGIFEFFLGNTFSFLVFMSFGSFYASSGAMYMPSFGVYASYSPDPINDPAAGLNSPEFNANMGFYWVAFTLLMAFFWICTIRTNVVFVALFACIVLGSCLLSGLYFSVAGGHLQTAHNLQLAAGGIFFVATIIGWYLFAALVFPTVDFPISLPMGDLTNVVPSLTQLRHRKQQELGQRKKSDADSVADKV
ncbi:unnamed protein product [Zymoseptoria tritici ST99CH_3D7]|uniref:GPR1/FUN34/YaaH-class plasma membrane protein n=1 Tax=Zymoseptoria tritici (strain ST99CH_3D7) TaxID=1276538 RepID=A0A1X7S3U4_ZYMT9|nr:unnamed protein product [Zymoseptoria tritici ST99CH_3D7]